MGSYLYRLLKQLFWVRMNVSKRLLFKTLEIEDTSKLIRRVMKKINGRTEERKHKYIFIENLTIKSIKFKLNWLFHSRNRAKKWNWTWKIDNEYVVRHWPKTQKFQEKRSKIVKEITNKEPLVSLLYKYEEWKNFTKMATMINNSIEELIKEYLI